jgi:hypothetical protein
MRDAVETLQIDGYTVEIHHDEDTESPRGEGMTLGTWVGFPHRNYNIGDEQMDPTEHWFNCPGCVDDDEPGCPRCSDKYGLGDGTIQAQSLGEFVELLKAERKARVMLLVGMIDHSGVAYYIGGGAHMSDPGGWDSGTCGVIFDTPEAIAKGWGDNPITDEEITKILTQEIETSSQWSQGFCYGYVINGPDGNEIADGSCWGFIGLGVYDEGGYMLDEIKMAVAQDRAETHEHRVTMFRGMVS